MFNFPFRKSSKSYWVKSGTGEEIEPQEVFLDSLARKKEEETGISEQRLEVPLLQKILQGFLVFSFLMLFALFGKTFHLQVVEGSHFSALSQANKFTVLQIRAERGVIYDRDFEQLVSNLPSFDLVVDTRKIPAEEEERARVLREVSEITGKDVDVLEEEIGLAENPQLLVVEDLDHQALILLEAKIGELPGFKILNNTIRDYKEGEVFSHVLGYTSKIKAEELEKEPDVYSLFDYVGRSGIESYYEDVLRKHPGQLRIETDALGSVISKEVTELPESGDNLVLWLDGGLQRKVEEVLGNILAGAGTKKGAVVAMNPKTGGILSLASFPAFDNNLFQKGADANDLSYVLEDPYQPLFNRAVSGRYLTGSVIKPLIASGVLEEGIIAPDKSLYCIGGIVILNPWDETSSSTKADWTTHGWTDMRKAIAESCNVYFYTVGGGYGEQEGLGPTRIKEYLQYFGWDEKTGIDLPGEAQGFIPDKAWKKEKLGEGWWDGDTYNLSIGQGYVLITPLEVVTAFSAIANGGTLYQPQVVDYVVDEKRNLVSDIEPKVISQGFIDAENLQVVREGMRQAVSGYNSPQASAVELNSLPVKVAAKTGTAEIGGGRYHNWITVFAPYDDPEIVLTIMIEDIKGVQRAVIPAAYSILNWYFSQ